MWNIYGLVGVILIIIYTKIILTFFQKVVCVIIGIVGGIFTLIVGIAFLLEHCFKKIWK